MKYKELRNDIKSFRFHAKLYLIDQEWIYYMECVEYVEDFLKQQRVLLRKIRQKYKLKKTKSFTNYTKPKVTLGKTNSFL